MNGSDRILPAHLTELRKETRARMPKYYVQSGSLTMIVTACDSEAAALWAIHRHSELPEIVDAACGNDGTEWDDLLPEWAQGEEFDATICVSERGPGRSEAGRFATRDALRKYGQLLVAVERLLGRMG